MIIKVYKEKVLLKDDAENTLAGIDFPEEEPGICKISEVYSDKKLGINVKEKLMSLALSQVRKNGWKVVPTAVFSQQWFNTHPDDRDLVATVVENKEADDGTKRIDFNGDVTEIENNEVEEPEEEPVVKGTHKVLRGFCRILQNICGLAMAAILALYLLNLYNAGGVIWVQTVIAGQKTENLIVLGVGAFFALFTFIEIFWTLSRPKNKEENRKYDSGRGLIPFILIAILYYAASYLVSQFASNNSILNIINLYFVQVLFIGYISIGGAVISLLRKLIGSK